MNAFGLSVLFGGWLLWVIPFAQARSRSPRAKVVTIDERGRWGMLLEVLAYIVLWIGPYRRRDPGDLRISFAVAFMILGIVLAWGGTRALGKQWRIEAGSAPIPSTLNRNSSGDIAISERSRDRWALR